MALKKIGRQTAVLQKPVMILASAAIAGKKEGEGPLANYYDKIVEDILMGEKTWEKAESRLMKDTFAQVIQKAGITSDEVDYLIAGDLLNQSMAANYGLRETEVPFYGVFGACSTMAESAGLGALLIDGGFAQNVVSMTSSHFCAAEKQFRFPLEMATLKTPTAQWTVTGAGALLLGVQEKGVGIARVTTGLIVDKGITDSNNMGAAMAPAAASTIVAHFKDTGLTPDYYDLIVTGDLGRYGKELCEEICRDDGYDISSRYNDCGLMVFDLSRQDVQCGGSGCGCSAIVLASYLMKQLTDGSLNKILFLSTGALMSPTIIQQGESIPGIAHAIGIERYV